METSEQFIANQIYKSLRIGKCVMFQENYRKIQQHGFVCCGKQRRYREKRDADPERRQKWLTYLKTKYKLDKKQRKKKLVKDMTPGEHRKEQKQWKKRQEQCREHKKHLQQQETPPNTSLLPLTLLHQLQSHLVLGVPITTD